MPPASKKSVRRESARTASERCRSLRHGPAAGVGGTDRINAAIKSHPPGIHQRCDPIGDVRRQVTKGLLVERGDDDRVRVVLVLPSRTSTTRASDSIMPGRSADPLLPPGQVGVRPLGLVQTERRGAIESFVGAPASSWVAPEVFVMPKSSLCSLGCGGMPRGRELHVVNSKQGIVRNPESVFGL